VVKDLKKFEIIQTVINGSVVARNKLPLIQSIEVEKPNKFTVGFKQKNDFNLLPCHYTKVIHALDHSLMTEGELIEQGVSSMDDILKITVVNRYENVSPSVAHVHGFGLKKGAIASSVAHDSHNIIAVGCSDALIAKAVNAIIASKGGICAVTETDVELLELPIAGLMSDLDGYAVARKYAKLDMVAKEELKSNLSAPFMTLSFMALLVIPELKLSDKGLFDGRSFHFIDNCGEE